MSKKSLPDLENALPLCRIAANINDLVITHRILAVIFSKNLSVQSFSSASMS